MVYNSRECCVLSAGVKGLLLHINTTHFMCTSLCLRTASTDQAGPPSSSSTHYGRDSVDKRGRLSSATCGEVSSSASGGVPAHRRITDTARGQAAFYSCTGVVHFYACRHTGREMERRLSGGGGRGG